MKNWKKFAALGLAVVMTAGALTGCGDGRGDSVSENIELSTGKINDTDSVFPKAEPFIDDTGKPMQRHGDYLYSYYDGRLMRTHKEDGETSLLYQTSPNSRLRFCFYEDLIFFVERTGYDSPDNADTALYRMEKDGSGQRLYDTASDILHDEARRKAMSAAMSSLGTIDAAEKILDAVMALVRSGKK